MVGPMPRDAILKSGEMSDTLPPFLLVEPITCVVEPAHLFPLLCLEPYRGHSPGF